MLKHKTNIRVRYADTDQMTFAYNGKYFEYFEVGRTEMMRDQNLTYKQIEENGYYMPVHSTYIEYKSPAFYDELLEIETRVEKFPELKIRIDHTVRSVNRDILICTGYVELVFVKKENGKLSRPPKFFIDAIKTFFNAI
jgi:acyl-CoA thioester hydrolase